MASHNGRDTRHAVSMLFAFALVALFAVLMLLMVVISAQGYKKTIDQGERTADLRTALGYVEGKVLSGAARDGVRVEKWHGTDVLFLKMITEEDELFETAIYYFDGMLMELGYSPDDMDFELDRGSDLIAIDAFTAQIREDGRLLTVGVRGVGGKEQSLRVALIAGEGADK